MVSLWFSPQPTPTPRKRAQSQSDSFDLPFNPFAANLRLRNRATDVLAKMHCKKGIARQTYKNHPSIVWVISPFSDKTNLLHDFCNRGFPLKKRQTLPKIHLVFPFVLCTNIAGVWLDGTAALGLSVLPQQQIATSSANLPP